MDLPEEDQDELKRLLARKQLEKGRNLTKDDLHDIFFEFMKDRKHLFQQKLPVGATDDLAGAISSTIAKNIHSVNVIILNTLIDKVEKGHYEGSMELAPVLNIKVPTDDQWEFCMGDKVVVDLPMREFKVMHQQRLRWTKKLKNVHGQYGYVTGVRNCYDCKINVYFPEILTSTTVFAGALRKTDKAFHDIPSRWKAGDFVRTKKRKDMMKKFQKRLPDIPEKHIGNQGKVIAVTSAGIFVTFNGTSSYAVNPSGLQKIDTPEPIPVKVVTNHPKGLRVGMEVRVISDLTRLVENQKDSGGWNWKMSSLAGQIVRISHIKKDGSLVVAMNVGRPWRLSYESVYLEADYHFDQPSSLPFLPGDVVRLSLTGNIRMHLLSAKVLESSIDFLKLPGQVEGIDDDLDVVVRFSNGKKQILNPSHLQKVTALQKQQFDVNKARRMSLQAGSRGKICPGPSRYIQDILSKMTVEPSTREAILSDSELLGYADEEHAVIRYDNNRTIRINKKFLYPADEAQHDRPREVDFDDLKSIVLMIKNCITAANIQGDSQDENGSVDIFSVSTGLPPTVCLRINSATATPQMVINNLVDISDWEITRGCENECCIKMQGDVEIDVVLLSYENEKSAAEITNLEDFVNPDTLREMKKPPPLQKQSSKNMGGMSGGIADFSVHESRGPMANGAPNIQGFDDFKFLIFHTSGGTLYFPYIPHTPAFEGRSTNARARESNVTNINIISQERNGRIHINSDN